MCCKTKVRFYKVGHENIVLVPEMFSLSATSLIYYHKISRKYEEKLLTTSQLSSRIKCCVFFLSMAGSKETRRTILIIRLTSISTRSWRVVTSELEMSGKKLVSHGSKLEDMKWTLIFKRWKWGKRTSNWMANPLDTNNSVYWSPSVFTRFS